MQQSSQCVGLWRRDSEQDLEKKKQKGDGRKTNQKQVENKGKQEIKLGNLQPKLCLI